MPERFSVAVRAESGNACIWIPFVRMLGKETWLRCLSVYVMISLAVCFPIPVAADLVYGRVHDKKGGVTFCVEDSTGNVVKDNIKIDQHGRYRVFLPPGVYRVKFHDGRTGVIRSYSEPKRQDIYPRWVKEEVEKCPENH